MPHRELQHALLEFLLLDLKTFNSVRLVPWFWVLWNNCLKLDEKLAEYDWSLILTLLFRAFGNPSSLTEISRLDLHICCSFPAECRLNLFQRSHSVTTIPQATSLINGIFQSLLNVSQEFTLSGEGLKILPAFNCSQTFRKCTQTSKKNHSSEFHGRFATPTRLTFHWPHWSRSLDLLAVRCRFGDQHVPGHVQLSEAWYLETWKYQQLFGSSMNIHTKMIQKVIQRVKWGCNDV